MKRYEETDSLGSFAALGTGFLYEFNARLKSLQVSRAGSCAVLAFFELNGLTSRSPFEFVALLEKTTQIEALKFSNNTNISLAETLDDAKLPAILGRAYRLALYAFDLKKEKFKEFSEIFINDHELRRVEIRKVEGYANTGFYIADIETRRRSHVSVRSSTLHGASAYLSEKIMQDIIAKEFGYNADAWVHKLLNTASILSTLSFVLNDRFDPARKAGGKNPSLPARLPRIIKNSINSTI